jgi:hypothetical protein
MKTLTLSNYFKTVEDSEIFTKDNDGNIRSIVGVEELYTDEDGEKKSVVTLLLGPVVDKNEEQETEEDPIIEVEVKIDDEPENDETYTEDEKFIDDINKELADSDKIDKDEAIKVKNNVLSDIKCMKKKYSDWYVEHYDKMAREAMKELFDSDEMLDNRVIGELKYYIYKNGWQDEATSDIFNSQNKNVVLSFLYKKLDDKVREKMSGGVRQIMDEINNTSSCEKNDKNCKKHERCCKDGPDGLDELIGEIQELMVSLF